MTYIEDLKDDALEKIQNLVALEDGDTWDDPYSILESIQNQLDTLNIKHDPNAPLGPEHDCEIIARGCQTTRPCRCNATNGHYHTEYEATLIGSNGKPY